MKSYIVFSALILTVIGTKEINVIESISKVIGNVVLECQREMLFKKELIDEFLSFWNTKHNLTNKDQGCVVACVLKKLDLLEPGGNLKKSKADLFCRANGADPEMTSKLEELYNLCSHAALTKNPRDGCSLAFEITKCFRFGVFQLNWAPKFSGQEKGDALPITEDDDYLY